MDSGASFEQPISAPADGDPLDYMGVSLSYSQAFGEEASWEKFSHYLDGYSIEGICRILSRISILLHKHRTDPATQVKILSGMFGAAGDSVLASARTLETEVRNTNPRSNVVLFSEQQLVNFLKAAFLVKDLDDPNPNERFVDLGRSLLMITDLTEGQPGDLNSVTESDQDFSAKWVGYLVSNFLFNNWEYGPNALARAFDIHLTDRDHLRNCGSYMDLPAAFERATGVVPVLAWGAMFQLSSYWSSVADPDNEEEPLAINARSFSEAWDFSQEQVETFLALMAVDADDLKRRIENHYTLENLSPYHVLPIAKSPLVRFGDRLICPIVKMGMEKLTKGLHYFFLDESIPREERQLYLTFKGAVFQDYVDSLLKRCFPSETRRYFSLDEHRCQFEGKIADGLILYEDSILVFETKASLFTLGARSGTNPDEIYARLRDIFVDAAEQIQATVDALESGELQIGSGFPSALSRFYPLIITLEDVPMNPFVYEEIRRMIDAESMLTDERTMPFQCIDIGELEQLEPAIAEGLNLRDLLHDKIDDQTGVADSFRNYLYRTNRDVLRGDNEYLKGRFRELGEDTLSYFRTRARDGSESQRS